MEERSQESSNETTVDISSSGTVTDINTSDEDKKKKRVDTENTDQAQ